MPDCDDTDRSTNDSSHEGKSKAYMQEEPVDTVSGREKVTEDDNDENRHAKLEKDRADIIDGDLAEDQLRQQEASRKKWLCRKRRMSEKPQQRKKWWMEDLLGPHALHR